MASNDLATLARCRALALAAMIDAGGNPQWVATRSPPAALAAAPAAAREAMLLAAMPPLLAARLRRTLARIDAGPTAAAMASLPAAKAAPVVQAPARTVAIVPPRGPAMRTGRVRRFDRF
jgi:hypothetical protein